MEALWQVFRSMGLTLASNPAASTTAFGVAGGAANTSPQTRE